MRVRRSVWTAVACELLGRDDALARHEAPLRGPAEEIVEVRIRPEVLRVAALVRAVHVDQRDVERGAPAPRRAPRRPRTASGRFGVAGCFSHDVGAEARPRREERQAERRGVEPPLEHPLVELERPRSSPVSRAARKWGSSGIESRETKP